MQYKIDNFEDFETMTNEEKLEKLKEIVEESFYDAVKEKTMRNNVSNNYIKPIIKKLHPIHNSEMVLEIVS